MSAVGCERAYYSHWGLCLVSLLLLDLDGGMHSLQRTSSYPCSARAVTICYFRHFNRSFYLLTTYLLTQSLTCYPDIYPRGREG